MQIFRRYLDILLARRVAGTVGGGGLHVGERGWEDGVLTSGDSLLPGNLGGKTGGAERNTSLVVLLVDGGGSLTGNLTGVTGLDGVDVGLGLLAAAVQVQVLVDVGKGGSSPGVGGVNGEGGLPQEGEHHPGGVGPQVVERMGGVAVAVAGDCVENKNLKKFLETKKSFREMVPE